MTTSSKCAASPILRLHNGSTMRIFDFNHPSHRPLWLRLLVVVGCFAWAAWEYANANTGWAILFAAIGAASLWGFFISFDPRDKPTDKNGRNHDA